MLTPTPHRKEWVAPEIVLEKALIAQAQEPETDGLGNQNDDPFLGPLSLSCVGCG